ncbi:MAG TPA: ferredoxin [Rhodopila sp.]|uniref:ferredoxin n=1 Tax=Rhodopila sp. TaxID=2480087 RepID=UPI002B9CFE71|nr:ferredoxin [Rhodopila sp.]HVY14421.1 ferredoxin [Rhodopila sp.]
MFVILTSKPGQFRTELTEGLTPREAWDYLFHGQAKAHFVIAELGTATKIRIVDETPPVRVNEIPCKFLEKFETVDAARAQLQGLVRAGRVDTALVRH